MPDNRENEILRQHLFETLRLVSPEWLLPSLFALIAFSFPFRAFPHLDAIKEMLSTSWVAILVFLVYQGLVSGWIYKQRKTLKTATLGQAQSCYRKNIFFAIFSFIFFPACGIFLQNPILIFGNMLISVLLWLPLAKTNRLIKLIYFQTLPSQERYEESSPCPNIFRKIASLKSLWALPLFLFALPFLFFLVIKFCFNAQIPFEMILYISGGFGLVGLVAAVLIAGEYWFIKQTATPSAFQRIIRNFTFPSSRHFSSYLERKLPEHEIVAYKWWLSHPGQPWPENMAELCKHIDIYSFDWQDPTAWNVPLEQAAREAQKARKMLASKDLPVLTIGSQAQEAAQKIAEQPVTQITPLFQAILSRDVAAVQKLLPTGELNRPFLGTGNTPLHVTALNGYTEIVCLLLEQPGLDTTRTNNEGKTALDLAREKGHVEIVQLLENK